MWTTACYHKCSTKLYQWITISYWKQGNRKQHEQFCSQTVGEKDQITGSDARLYAVKLAKFTQTIHQEGKVNNDILTICNSLAEIINICYDNYTRRTPKQILRRHNLCYLFSRTYIPVLGNPNVMSERQFFGNHFQSNHTCSRDLQLRKQNAKKLARLQALARQEHDNTARPKNRTQDKIMTEFYFLNINNSGMYVGYLILIKLSL